MEKFNKRNLGLYLALICWLVVQDAQGQKFASALSKQSTRIIQMSRDGTTIRQCSCGEQKTCMTEIREQTYDCFNLCWDVVKTITNQSEQLKYCFSSKEQVLSGFVNCLEANINSCVNGTNGPQIPNADLRTLIKNTERRIMGKTRDILRTLDIHGKEIMEKALEVAACIKECVLEKNKIPYGFCFERKGCLPKVDSYDTEFTLKKCMRSTKWKKEAAELCSCSVNAGVSGAQEYCNLLTPFAPASTPKSRT